MPAHANVNAAAEDNGAVSPYGILAPDEQTVPLVFASPHSGRGYPPEFLEDSRLDAIAIRRSEDAFIDEVFAAAPEFGAPLLCANFPRAYVDSNREAYELDADMFEDELPDYVNTTSPMVDSGLGTIARLVASGDEIYDGKLRFADARKRIERCYIPYHEALRGLLESTHRRFGLCILIDCHSMPSVGGPMDRDPGLQRVDMVLGDCHGTSCAPALTETVERTLKELGFAVRRNDPYSGGFTTRHYGSPGEGAHALQIEVNRGLYMDETAVARGPGLPGLAGKMKRLIEVLAGIDPEGLPAG